MGDAVAGRGRWPHGLVVMIMAVGLVSIALWHAGHLSRRIARPDDADLSTGVTRYPGDSGIVAPLVEAPSLMNGKTVALRHYLGHVVVINVWGSWCGPCRAEAPDLAEVSRETEPRGVRFLGIDVRDDPVAARDFERAYGITYPSLDDQNGDVLGQFTGVIPISAVPSTIVLDASGTIRARVIGRVDGKTLRSLIADAEDLG